MIKNSKYSIYYIAATVFVLTLAVRLLYLLKVSQFNVFLSPGGDAQIYQEWAELLLSGGSIRQPYFRAPLYPEIIALLAQFFSNDTFWPVRILQVIVSSFAAIFLALSANILFGKRYALIAGMAWAFYGMSIYFDGEGLITSFYTSLFILLIYLLLLFKKSLDIFKPKNFVLNLIFIVLIAGTLGILTTLRANALLWWPVVLFAIYYYSSRKNRLHAISNTLLALTVAFLIIQPVLKHNQRFDGGFKISTQGGINLFLGNHDQASGLYADDPEFGNDWTETQIIYRAEKESGRKLKALEVDNFYRDRAVDYIKDNPLKFLLLTGKRLLFVVNEREIGNNRVLQPYFKEVGYTYYLMTTFSFRLLFLLAFPFAFKLWKENKDIRLPLILGFVHILSILFFFINARYRFPVVPLLILMATGGLSYYINGFKISTINWKSDGKFFLAFFIALVISSLPVTGERNQDLTDSWYFHQGNAAMRLHDWDSAKSAFQKLIEVEPEFKNANLNLGVCYLNKEKLDSAYYYFEQETTYNSNNPKAYNNLGVVSEHRQQFWKALSYYNTAYTLAPYHQDFVVNYSRMLMQLCQSSLSITREETLTMALKAVSLMPENLNYRFQLAGIYVDFDELGKALDQIDIILNVMPDNERALQVKKYIKYRQSGS